MFDKIEIERFRGIKYASIEGFKQINLFFGKNNCGKSSLLESLFFSQWVIKSIATNPCELYAWL